MFEVDGDDEDKGGDEEEGLDVFALGVFAARTMLWQLWFREAFFARKSPHKIMSTTLNSERNGDAPVCNSDCAGAAGGPLRVDRRLLSPKPEHAPSHRQCLHVV